jgi:hypothetical protein
MTIRNRELSQFGSFIYVDNSSKEIGITTESLPFVGIGTTNPTQKLHVIGSALVEGDFEATGNITFDVNNIDFSDPGNNFDIFTSGIVTAGEFRNTSGGILTAFDSWSQSGVVDIYRDLGNVGFGSTLPQEKIDVIGNIAVDGNIELSGTSNILAVGVITAGQFISTVSAGTSPFEVESNTLVQNLNAQFLSGGEAGGTNSGDIVTINATQNLSNKTISATGLKYIGNTGGTFTLRGGSGLGANINLPSSDGILVVSDTGFVTSAVITDGTIVNDDINSSAAIDYSKLNLSNSIVNADIAAGAGIDITKLSANTISGVTLGNSLATLTRGAYLTGSNYNGSSATTWGVDATTTSDPGKVVVRDNNGDFVSNNIVLNGNLNCNTLTVADAITANSYTSSDPVTGLTAEGVITTNSVVESINVSTGALVIGGGAGIGGNLNLGGWLSVAGFSTFSDKVTITGITSITNTTESTSVSTGALVVDGGVGIGSTVHIGGDLIVAGDIIAGGGGLIQVLHVQDRKVQAANNDDEGGTFTEGSWQTRVLNTIVTNTIPGSNLAANQITLPAGTYQITLFAPAYGVGSHRARLNGTGVLIYGTNENNLILGGGTKQSAMTYSKINVLLTLASQITDLKIEHRCESTRNTDGFGVATEFGTNGVDYQTYTDVYITKLA